MIYVKMHKKRMEGTRSMSVKIIIKLHFSIDIRYLQAYNEATKEVRTVKKGFFEGILF